MAAWGLLYIMKRRQSECVLGFELGLDWALLHSHDDTPEPPCVSNTRSHSYIDHVSCQLQQDHPHDVLPVYDVLPSHAANRLPTILIPLIRGQRIASVTLSRWKAWLNVYRAMSPGMS